MMRSSTTVWPPENSFKINLQENPPTFVSPDTRRRNINTVPFALLGLSDKLVEAIPLRTAIHTPQKAVLQLQL